MAIVTNEDRKGHIRTTVVLEPGERVLLCRCFKSEIFPFCDGKHKEFDNTIGPVAVQAPVENRSESS